MSVFRFLRRPFLRGNTNNLVQGPPTLRSENRRADATLSFGFLTPATLSVRVDGTLRVVALASAAINDIVTALNTPITGLIDATASDEGGFLVITGNSVGDGAQLRVESSAPAVDAAVDIGFALHPDPLATSDGGDRSFSPAGLSELNPPGTYYATGGEDVTSGVLNRAIDALAYNGDYLAASLDRLIALPMVIDNIDPTVAPWNTRVLPAVGPVEQVDLSTLSTVDSGLSNRIYLGRGLSNVSNLNDIADYFAVVEEDTLAEMVVGGETVRVVCVTHGERIAPVPTFDSAGNLLAGAVPDVAMWTPLDGGNLLGLNFRKTVAAGIDEIVYNTAIRVLGAPFQTAGVDVYDRVVISGAGVTTPFNHDGTYQVEAVYSDEMLLLRGATPEDRGELNDSPGVLGTAEVWANSEFATDVWLTFDPPIPVGKKFRVIVGGGYQLGSLPTDYLLKLAISTSEEVDSLVQQVIREMKGPLVNSTDDFTEAPFAHSVVGNPFVYSGPLDSSGDPLISMEFLHRRTTLQGAYDGQGLGGGGGFFVNVDWNAPEWNNQTPPIPRAHTSVGLTGLAATILAGNVFFAPGQAFTIDDVGRQVLITSKVSGAVRLRAAFVIIDYINSETVVLEPGEWNPTIPLGGDYGYSVVTGRFDGFPAAMSTHVLQSASFGRLGYVHEEDRVAGRFYGHHMLAVREATTHTDGAVPEGLQHFVIEFAVLDAGDGWVHVGFDPSGSSNIRALAAPSPSYSQSVIRLTDTENNDGWYLVTQLDGGLQRIRVMNFDGQHPSFVASGPDGGRGHLYTQPQGTFLTRAGNALIRVGHSFFEDAIELQETVTAPDTIQQLGVVGVDWRGQSNGFFAYINDSDFAAYIRGDSAQGSAAYFSSYMPANGLESWHTGSIVGANLAPGGAALATAAERGGWAGAFVAETFSMNGAAADPAMKGAALYVAQKGTDAALVAVGWAQGGVHGGVPSPDDLTFVDGKATIVSVREDTYSMMQSGSQELLGAYYQWDPRSFWPGGDNLHKMYGGTYTELPMGSRFSNSPISVASGDRYHLVDGKGGTKLSRLGQPGRTMPPSYTSTSIAAFLQPPDPARSRSHRTSGFIVWDGTTDASRLLEDPAAYIGQQIKLDAAIDAYDGVYTIINVDIPDGENPRYWVEVLLDGVTLPVDIGDNKIKILGARWHFANLDLESFALLGTHRVESGKTGHYDLAAIAGILPPSIDGVTAAARRDYANGTGIVQIGAGSWTLGLATGTSRHPIANEAWHQLREPLGFGGSATALTNFETGEWAFRVAGPARYNINTAFDESFDGAGVGGAIRIHWDTPSEPGPFTPESLFAYVQVSELQFRRHYSYTVTLRLKHIGLGGATAGQLKTVRVALVDGIGGSLISLEKSFTMDFFADDEVTTQITFNSTEMGFDLREEAVDAMNDNGPVVLRLALGHTLAGGFPAGAHTMYVFQAAVEEEQQATVAGHLVTTGAVSSAGFELHTEALDWKTYGPECAGPYGNIGYGDVRPLILNSQGIPTPPAIQYVADGGATIDGFLDLMSPSTFWFRGRNDAAFLFLGGKFAPPTLIDGAGVGVYELNNVDARRGGQVGHIISLDPPHGSILSTLHVAMSIRPAGTPGTATSTELLQLNGKTLNWGVVYDVECDVEDKMEALEGYLIELWRYSALPTENHPQSHAGATLSSSEVGAWDDFAGGFSELIHSEVVDLDSTAFTEGVAGQQNDTKCGDVGPTVVQGVRNENFILTKIDLTDPFGAAKNERMLQVDRRQYSYFVVVKAWGVGTPRELSTATIDSTLYPIPFGGAFRWGVREIGGGGEGITSAFNSFTRFKFRGATLGCRYTRMNP